MKFVIDADQDAMQAFIKWTWSWFEYDSIDMGDEFFRSVAEITWQIDDQLKRAEK